MADSKLTDLPALTLINDNDVLYVVKTNENTSNSINFGDLANSLVTNNNTFSAGLVKQVNDNTIDVGAALVDITSLTLSAEELNATVGDLDRESIRLFTLQFPEITITTGSRFFSGFDINELRLEPSDTKPLPEFELSDTYTTTISSVGGLSGLQTEMYLLCASNDGLPAVELNLFNNTGATVKIPENTLFAVNKLATS
jgi:hypothetical protein